MGSAVPFVPSEPASRRPPRAIRQVKLLVRALGGPTGFAAAIGISTRQVYRWMQAGCIPAKREADVAGHAKRAGCVWRP